MDDIFSPCVKGTDSEYTLSYPDVLLEPDVCSASVLNCLPSSFSFVTCQVYLGIFTTTKAAWWGPWIIKVGTIKHTLASALHKLRRDRFTTETNTTLLLYWNLWHVLAFPTVINNRPTSQVALALPWCNPKQDVLKMVCKSVSYVLNTHRVKVGWLNFKRYFRF